MHELSIAQNIIEIVTNTFAKSNAQQINEIELEIGEFSGVELDALEFALETSLESTQFKNAEFFITTRQGRGNCNNCKSEFEMKTLYDTCPDCNSFDIDIVQGQELRVKSINVD